MGQENTISNESRLVKSQRKVAPADQSSRFSRKAITKSYRRKVRKTKKSFFRHAFVGANIALILVVSGVVWAGQDNTSTPTKSLANSISINGNSNAIVTAPLDDMSSADIAANVAYASNLSEAPNVSEQADSYSIQLASAPVGESIIAKPQLVAGGSKTRNDIQKYVVLAGDTVPSLAAKYGITSDSIRWSNNISGDAIAVGKELQIPPRNGIIYTVAAGDTVESIAAKYSANKEQLIAFNDIELSGLKPGETILVPDGQKAAPTTSSRTVSANSGGAFSFSFTARFGGNGYSPGYCTWYVASRVSIPSNWGNANTWDNRAPSSGFRVSSVPVAGAILHTDTGWAGHVGIVEEVSPDGKMIIYSDMNGLKGYGHVGTSGWVPASTFPRYIYR